MTPRELAIATGARIDRATEYQPYIEATMSAYYIDLTPERKGMFLANVGHECGGFRYMVEIWGPTEAQRRYEGRLDLGNTQPGDGFRFRGRGAFNTTGRGNYASARDRLRARFPDLQVPDFEQEPERMAEPQWACLAAGDYVSREGLNAWADAADFDGYCDLVNRGRKTPAAGDANGYAARLALFNAGQEVFA